MFTYDYFGIRHGEVRRVQNRGVFVLSTWMKRSLFRERIGERTIYLQGQNDKSEKKEKKQ